MKKEKFPEPILDRRHVLALALQADVDVRTARRALIEGITSIKGAVVRERLRQAAEELYFKVPERTRLLTKTNSH